MNQRQLASKRDPALEGEILAWIELVIGERLPAGSYEEILRNGVVLCRLINKIAPKSIVKFNTTGNQSFKFRENIELFRNACVRFGVRELDVFQTSDLYDRRNIPAVTRCLLALGRACSSSMHRHDYKGPQLILTTSASLQSQIISGQAQTSSASATMTEATLTTRQANGRQRVDSNNGLARATSGRAFDDLTNKQQDSTTLSASASSALATMDQRGQGDGEAASAWSYRPYREVEDSIRLKIEREIVETVTEFEDDASSGPSGGATIDSSSNRQASDMKVLTGATGKSSAGSVSEKGSDQFDRHQRYRHDERAQDVEFL